VRARDLANPVAELSMSWWKGGPSAREVQLKDFERAFPHARKTAQQNSTHYDVAFGNSMMRVYLHQRFPDEPPFLQLLAAPAQSHPWINENNAVTGHSYLRAGRWRKDCQLATLVQEVIATLAAPAPTPTPAPASVPAPASEPAVPTPVRQASLPPTYEASSSALPPAPPPLVSQPSEVYVPVPPVPDSFPELDALGTSALTALVDNAAVFHGHVNSMAGVQLMQEMRADAIRANAFAAAATLARRPAIDALKSEAASLEEQLRKLRVEYEAKVATNVAADQQRTSDAAVLRSLSGAATQAEAASDALASELCAGTMDSGEFVRQFLSLRRKYHQNHALVELRGKWTENGAP